MSPRVIASLVLIGTCALWAFSFPLLKSIEQLGQRNAPGNSSLFLSTLLVAFRFSFAAGLFIVGNAIRCRWRRRDGGAGRATGIHPTALEWKQGLGIGVFGSLGLILQMDGLAYTDGSVSAFLTQGYAVLIPVWVALTARRLPGWSVVGACLLVGLGAALLAGVSPDHLHLGRGELETLAGSVLFAGQILWLERPCFAANDSVRATTVMFGAMALTAWPLAFALARHPADVVRAAGSGEIILLFTLLLFGCTLVTFPLANHWQPKVTATQAGLLYCTEPVFTSLVCLFVPGWISRTTGLTYPNESLHQRLILGGSCILAANVWILLRPPPKAGDTGCDAPTSRSSE
jgi:hypothetical protein